MPKNKKGQTLELIGGTIIGFMVIIFLVFAVLFGISSLNPGSFFTSGSADQNATNALTGNLTSGVGAFAGYIPEVLTVLAVVVILSAIALLILYVRRMQGSAGSGGSAL